MGRTRKEESPVDSATRSLDPKSKAIDKARARQAREAAKKSYKEDSESESDIEKLIEEPADKDFSGEEEVEPSPSESGSDWDGESSGSEYGKKKPKGRGRGKKAVAASPKKGGGRGRGRGRPPAKGRASTGSKNGSKKGPVAKRRRDDSDESEESEGESSGSEYGKKAAPKKRGNTSRGSPAKKRATASPAAVSEDTGRRSRGRASVSKSYKEVSEEDFSEEEVAVPKKASPKKGKPPAKPAPKKGKAKEESEEEDQFSDALSGSEEDEAPKEKKKASNSKSKAEEKTDNGNKATKNGGREDKETNNAKEKDEEESDNESKKSDKSDVSSKSSGSEKAKDVGENNTLKNRTDTDYSKIVFSTDKKSPSGNSSNFKISSWNIGGIKAFLKKNGLEYIKQESPDIICFQEIKCNEKTKPEEVQKVDGYPHLYWSFSDQPGMHGVAILSKTEPKEVKHGLPADDDDSDDDKSSKEKFSKEGRLITAEYEKFYLINAYVPNSGRGEKTEKDPKGYPPKINSGERQKFDELFRNYVKKLEKTKPVIVTGDLNVSHKEIDLANPKTNERTAGFTKEEREGFSKLLEETTLFDAFRKLYPDQKGAYTFWSYMHNSRQKNIGWRLDYFLVSEKLGDSLCENVMRTEVYGSDHCPIVLFLSV